SHFSLSSSTAASLIDAFWPRKNPMIQHGPVRRAPPLVRGSSVVYRPASRRHPTRRTDVPTARPARLCRRISEAVGEKAGAVKKKATTKPNADSAAKPALLA